MPTLTFFSHAMHFFNVGCFMKMMIKEINSLYGMGASFFARSCNCQFSQCGFGCRLGEFSQLECILVGWRKYCCIFLVCIQPCSTFRLTFSNASARKSCKVAKVALACERSFQRRDSWSKFIEPNHIPQRKFDDALNPIEFLLYKVGLFFKTRPGNRNQFFEPVLVGFSQ